MAGKSRSLPRSGVRGSRSKAAIFSLNRPVSPESWDEIRGAFSGASVDVMKEMIQEAFKGDGDERPLKSVKVKNGQRLHAGRLLTSCSSQLTLVDRSRVRDNALDRSVPVLTRGQVEGLIKPELPFGHAGSRNMHYKGLAWVGSGTRTLALQFVNDFAVAHEHTTPVELLEWRGFKDLVPENGFRQEVALGRVMAGGVFDDDLKDEIIGFVKPFIPEWTTLYPVQIPFAKT